jgi:putative tryptophan/tyrosine transport system substrate-binding protein
MRRREFIAGLGGAAAWPLAAPAQQPIRHIAVLMPIRDTDPEEQARVQALVRRLQQLGWTDGRNLRIDLRSAGGNTERSREIAAEFVALAPDVIISSGSVATAEMKRATSSIPIVFVAVNEPVAQGFVTSLARPGGNITGFTLIDFSVIGKSVELLKAMVPTLTRVGLMFNPDTYPAYESYLRTFQAEPRRPTEVVSAAVRSPAEIDSIIQRLGAQRDSGLAVLADGGFNLTNRTTINAALERHRVPSIASYRQFASDGALMSYGADTIDLYSRAANYVDRILKGAKPADLPVQQPVKFELVVNRKTANGLGLEISPALLALADEVIE